MVVHLAISILVLTPSFSPHSLDTVPAENSKMTAPIFEKSLMDLEIVDGQKLELECTVNGDPEPKVTWLKNNSIISSSEILELKYKNGVARLIINEVFPEDEGLYVCQAKNSVGKAETQCNLKVKSMR